MSRAETAPDGTAAVPRLEGVQNFRQMGGLPVPGGTIRRDRLFRSGHWSQATESDRETLGRYGLSAVVDFRTDVDRTGDGGSNRLPDGPDYHQLEMVDSDGDGQVLRTALLNRDQALLEQHFGNGQAEALARQFVLNLALDPAKQQVYARFLQVVVAAAGQPVLWHCSAGKDRAGWGATLLAITLGVPDEAIVDHYEVSNVHRPPEGRLAYHAERGVDASVIKPFLMVDGAHLRAGLAAIDDGWPSRERYLVDALGLGPDQIETLRANLIDA